MYTWLTELDQRVRDGIKIVTMDGFTGYAAAVDRVLTFSSTSPPMAHPFTIVSLIDECTRA